MAFKLKNYNNKYSFSLSDIFKGALNPVSIGDYITSRTSYRLPKSKSYPNQLDDKYKPSLSGAVNAALHPQSMFGGQSRAEADPQFSQFRSVTPTSGYPRQAESPYPKARVVSPSQGKPGYPLQPESPYPNLNIQKQGFSRAEFVTPGTGPVSQPNFYEPERQPELEQIPEQTPEQVPEQVPEQEADPYSPYMNPYTGEVMSPDEYATYIASKLPGGGMVGDYNKQTLGKDLSSDELAGIAKDYSDVRGDYAVGTEKPDLLSMNIPFSPEERQAIQNAYAGVFDPVLNDVYDKIRKKETAEAKSDAHEQSQRDIIMKTNESIRLYNETVKRTKDEEAERENTADAVDRFSTSQLNSGASAAGLTLNEFVSLDPEVKNFYVNMPMGWDEDEEKLVPMDKIMAYDFNAIKAGKADPEKIKNYILAGNLPATVKMHLIGLMPAAPTTKKGFVSWVNNLFAHASIPESNDVVEASIGVPSQYANSTASGLARGTYNPTGELTSSITGELTSSISDAYNKVRR